MSGLKVVTAPALAPVGIDELKDHLRIDGVNEEAYLSALTVSALARFESMTNLSLINTTFDYVMDEFPAGDIIVPRAPLVSVTSITYTDSSGNTGQTWASSNYTVDTSSNHRFGRIARAYGKTYPGTYSEINVVAVRFVAGFGAAPSSVPEDIKMAVLRIAASMYENREGPDTQSTSFAGETAFFARLAYPHKVHA